MPEVSPPSPRLVALVVRCSAYTDRQLAARASPVPHANGQAMASFLKEHGFEVVTCDDPTRKSMDNILDSFRVATGKGSLALVYYSGIATKSGGASTLLMADGYEYHIADVLQSMTAATASMVLVDACTPPLGWSDSEAPARPPSITTTEDEGKRCDSNTSGGDDEEEGAPNVWEGSQELQKAARQSGSTLLAGYVCGHCSGAYAWLLRDGDDGTELSLYTETLMRRMKEMPQGLCAAVEAAAAEVAEDTEGDQAPETAFSAPDHFLYSFCKPSQAIKAALEFTRNGDMTAFAHTARANAHSTEVQLYAANMVDSYILGSKGNRQALGELGMCEVITRIFSDHAHSADAVERSLVATAELTKNTPENQERFYKAGLCEPLAAAMARHSGSRDVQCRGAEAITALTDGHAGLCAALGEAGCCEALAAALRAHGSEPTDFRSLTLGVTALAEGSAANQRQLARAGACDALVARMQQLPESSGACVNGMRALSALAANDDNDVCLRDALARWAVGSAMKGGSEEVQRYGERILKALNSR